MDISEKFWALSKSLFWSARRRKSKIMNADVNFRNQVLSLTSASADCQFTVLCKLNDYINQDVNECFSLIDCEVLVVQLYKLIDVINESTLFVQN